MTKTISQQLAEKTFRELGIDPKMGRLLSSLKDSPNNSLNRSPRIIPPFKIKALGKTRRQSSDGKTYESSALYRNAVVLQLLTKIFTRGLNPIKFSRLISQMDSSARSVVANIREGYVRPTSSAYSEFLGFSQGSLEELRGDFIDCNDDGLLSSKPGSSLISLNLSLKPPTNISPNEHLRDLKRIIGEIKSKDLSYEIFMELTNKTDWLLKRTVEGIDRKIIGDEKQKLNEELNTHWSKHW